MVEKDTDSAWYTTLNGVTGATTEFKLAGIPTRGGNLVAIDSITKDGGDGVDDLICFFMSSGDVLIYTGTDPALTSPLSVFLMLASSYQGAPL